MSSVSSCHLQTVSSVTMSTNQKHFLARVHETISQEENYSDWKIAKSHPLKPLLRQLPQWFYCSGECEELASVTLNFKRDVLASQDMNVTLGKSGESNGFLGTLSSPDTKKILELCNPSSFGKGSETVFDELFVKERKLKEKRLI
jgi:hypothetical protein